MNGTTVDDEIGSRIHPTATWESTARQDRLQGSRSVPAVNGDATGDMTRKEGT